MLEEGGGYDLVAVDFYSRFQRPTAPSCDRFAAAPGAPACKPNRLRWCHTDLGANIIAYPRFLREGRRFGGLEVRGPGRPRALCCSAAVQGAREAAVPSRWPAL